MTTASSHPVSFREIPILLRAEPATLARWLRAHSLRRTVLCVVAILIGAGLYGAVIGSWRSPLQACYAAVKLPLILLLTTFGNALINAILAPLMGLNLTFRESLLAVLMSFSIVAVILGSFSPLVAFLIWNLPPLSDGLSAAPTAHAVLLLSQVGVIALAGIAGNVRLVHLLRQLSPNPSTAHRVLFTWLLVNMFLGAQLTWMLRPFFGSPHLPVEFFRSDALEGNFYESVYYLTLRLLGS